MSGRSFKKRKTGKYEARELWERSPTPVEDFGSDDNIDFTMEVAGEEVGYCGEVKYEVQWMNWARADGTSTTWEGADTTTTHLPTTTWEDERMSKLPDRPDMVLWGTTDIANTRTRERKQGYEESTQEEVAKFQEDFDGMMRRMDDLMAKSKEQYPDIYRRYTGDATSRPGRPPAKPQPRSDAPPPIPLPRQPPNRTYAQAVPSRIQVNAVAGPSRSRTSTSRPPATPPATSSSSHLPTATASYRVSPPRRASPAISVSSSESIQLIDAPAPTTKPMPPTRTKRKATSPASVPPPPSKRRSVHVPPDPLSTFASASTPNLGTAGPSKLLPLPSRASVRSQLLAASSTTPTASASRPSLPNRAADASLPILPSAPPSPSGGTRRPRVPSPPPAATLSSASAPPPPHTRAASAHDLPQQRRMYKRKAHHDDEGADATAPRKCACGTLLPPPDVSRGATCDTCPKQGPARSKVASGSTSSIHAMRSASVHSARASAVFGKKTATPSVLVPDPIPLPLPGSTRKGKARESAKSLRLQTETSWSTQAESVGAAGITFVNEVDEEELPPTLRGAGWEFKYLEEEYDLPPEIEAMKAGSAEFFTFCGCEGEGECQDAKGCGCQAATPERDAGYAYTDGLFNFTYQWVQVVVECNPYCRCSTECPNRVAQRPRTVPIEVFKTVRCGWGVRAPVDVERGTVLGMYTGRLITRTEAEGLSGDARLYCFDLDYNEEGEYTVDSLKCGNWTRFINHSCEPNLRIQPVVYDTIPSQNMAYLAFIATVRIPARTELTFDYDPGHQQGATPPPDATPCSCGARRCRGWGSFGLGISME
ncbi:hypothetical protein B0H15DRAFT_856663 [Mycena belliarum]|uniref:SET domain-containing protein n=1 Tax=Mycena belliarum TaxID=1033014 RepID=A0AAD6TUZ7_9AGAR|nr:hypothetical protein B0H15DRAFT_856663 [Mycena belliae]